MKALIKVTGLVALAGAAFFAISSGSAFAGPPPPSEDAITPHGPLPPCLFDGTCADGPDLLPVDPCVVTGTCGFDPVPVDPCVFDGTCGDRDDGADDSGGGLLPLDPCVVTGTCGVGPLLPLDPCVFDDSCAAEDGEHDAADDSGDADDADDDSAGAEDVDDDTVEPVVTPSGQPAATKTGEPVPTDQPTVVPPAVNPPEAGNGGIVNDISSGVMFLAAMSLTAMALAWTLLLLTHRRTLTER